MKLSFRELSSQNSLVVLVSVLVFSLLVNSFWDVTAAEETLIPVYMTLLQDKNDEGKTGNAQKDDSYSTFANPHGFNLQ